MDKALRLISEYPIESFKEYLISCTHFFLLKPNEIHFLFENNISSLIIGVIRKISKRKII